MPRYMLLLCAAAVVLRADSVPVVIDAPGFAAPEAYDQYWVGTFTGLTDYGDGSQTGSVAQLITVNTSGAYDDLTLAVQLEDIDSGDVTFSLAPDNNGQPGTALGSTSVSLAGGSMALTTYDLGFDPSISISSGTYWLIASSPTVESLDDPQHPNQIQLPNWAVSGCLSNPVEPGAPTCNAASDTIALNYNGSWRTETGGFAFELDGVDPPAAVPEPRFCWLLGVLIPALFTLRRFCGQRSV